MVYKDDCKTDPDADDQSQMYNTQFYKPFTNYGRSIFAIAGNHDGKHSKHGQKSAIDHFMLNFCATQQTPSSDNTTDKRPAMTQPYVYWRLSTPLAYIIGLNSNIANGGILDDPAQSEKSQYDWLVAQLQDVKAKNINNTPRKAVLLALHHPPYSGATNFDQRGDPACGPTPAAADAHPLGEVLQQAFIASGLRPDAVFSAHAHLYQRLTYRYSDGWEIPFVVVGCGGHGPVENMWAQCNTQAPPATLRNVPFDAVLPNNFVLPSDETVQVVAYNDSSFGFLRLTITVGTLTSEFFTANTSPPILADTFVLDINSHHITSTI